MAKKRCDLLAPASPLDGLFARVVAILERARARVVRSVNSEMVLAYWHIGREIVEQDQGGRRRAAYGEAVLEALSQRLTTEFGRGFDVTNLRKMRQFFRMFEIRDAVRLESGKGKQDTARLVSGVEATRIMACDDLSWSHYRLLMQVDDSQAREWYTVVTQWVIDDTLPGGPRTVERNYTAPFARANREEDYRIAGHFFRGRVAMAERRLRFTSCGVAAW